MSASKRSPSRSPRATQAVLADTLERWTRGRPPDWPTPIAHLSLFRREAPTDPAPCLVEPSVVVVAQGAKCMWWAGQPHPYDVGHFLITTLDVPAASQVTQASREAPCLGLVLRLDWQQIAELIAQGSVPPCTPVSSPGMGLGRMTPELLDPIARLVQLLDEPAAQAVLAPLVQREIHFRLLTSELAPLLWRIAAVGGQGQRIARAVDWIKTHYTEPLRIETLARQVQMSESSLHHHFRQLTGMSPLQYQKSLRLHEARRLMLNEGLDAAEAAYRVGYESPSQFNREYRRLFGAPPKRDVERLLPAREVTTGLIV